MRGSGDCSVLLLRSGCLDAMSKREQDDERRPKIVNFKGRRPPKAIVVHMKRRGCLERRFLCSRVTEEQAAAEAIKKDTNLFHARSHGRREPRVALQTLTSTCCCLLDRRVHLHLDSEVTSRPEGGTCLDHLEFRLLISHTTQGRRNNEGSGLSSLDLASMCFRKGSFTR